MSSIKNWSLRAKIISVGILVPSVLMIFIFVLYYQESKKKAVDSYVEKARAICLTAESTRQEMEDKWAMGLLTKEMLQQFAANGEMGKVLASVPVVTAWGAAQRKAEEGGYEFRVPKFSPRNPVNEPDELEARALKAMKSEGLDEYYEIDHSINSVRYFRPVILTETCMLCHGDPATSLDLWGNDRGLDPTGVKMENWKVGEIHGAFEVVQSLDEADAALMGSLRAAGMVMLIGLIAGTIAFIFVARSITNPINRVIDGMGKGSDQVSSASGQVSQSSQEMASGASQQAASLEEISASLEEMSSMTRQNADNAKQANSMASEAQGAAEKSQEAMERMSTAISKIKASSDETAKIIKTIDEIAFQTNLLALNAAVEAARAGDAGKGFAVVAEEVRNLAQRSAEAARTTSDLIEESKGNAESGVTASGEVDAILKQIVDSISKVTQLVNEVSSASSEQAQGIEQVNTAVSQLDKITQGNAANAEESAAASEELTAQAHELSQMVGALTAIVGGTSGDGGAGGATATAVVRPAPHTPRSAAEAAPRPASKSPTAPQSVIPLTDDELQDF